MYQIFGHQTFSPEIGLKAIVEIFGFGFKKNLIDVQITLIERSVYRQTVNKAEQAAEHAASAFFRRIQAKEYTYRS